MCILHYAHNFFFALFLDNFEENVPEQLTVNTPHNLQFGVILQSEESFFSPGNIS